MCHMKFKTMNNLVKNNLVRDSKLPVTFWAEAVNTACYVQNRVLIVKSQGKTPYELFNKKKPFNGFFKPFGCPCTILNTKTHLGKFDCKADDGFLVGYSSQSKAYRVFNTSSRIIEESDNVKCNESTPNKLGTGPDWLFDIDSLTNSLGFSYENNAGTGTESVQDKRQEFVLFPIPTADSTELYVQEKKDALDSKDTDTAQNEEERGEKEDQFLTSEQLQPEMPALAEDDTDDENSSVFGGSSPEKNDSNLDAEINEEAIHQTKVHKDHPPHFCEEKGIERQYSAPRTPQQNGVAERRNRTLIEVQDPCWQIQNCQLHFGQNYENNAGTGTESVQDKRQEFVLFPIPTADSTELCVQEKKDALDSKDTDTAQNEKERDEKEDQFLTSEQLQPEMPALAEDDTDDENSSAFGGSSPEKNDSNLDAEINEEAIHQIKVHKDHPPHFCEEKGIERQYSAPRTPQQNGVAERRNRTLIEVQDPCWQIQNCQLHFGQKQLILLKKDALDSKDTDTAQNEEERGEKEDQFLTSEQLQPEMPALAEDDTDDENSSVFGGSSPEKNDSNLETEINEEAIHQTKVHKDHPPQSEKLIKTDCEYVDENGKPKTTLAWVPTKN
ncbi:hypothetical protein L6452_22389 [Arctium lappa]|uniref:Uncharacterized protein n=1 Tax=Arctium lappa TaxID=4217 RepID=A0ACB9AZY9_ARCLA|nr:hypothetical protein L6452_22389 [Arctium lappa]